jgi:hypothetical protein
MNGISAGGVPNGPNGDELFGKETGGPASGSSRAQRKRN